MNVDKRLTDASELLLAMIQMYENQRAIFEAGVLIPFMKRYASEMGHSEVVIEDLPRRYGKSYLMSQLPQNRIAQQLITGQKPWYQ